MCCLPQDEQRKGIEGDALLVLPERAFPEAVPMEVELIVVHVIKDLRPHPSSIEKRQRLIDQSSTSADISRNNVKKAGRGRNVPTRAACTS
jgi:hypothetical protein